MQRIIPGHSDWPLADAATAHEPRARDADSQSDSVAASDCSETPENGQEKRDVSVRERERAAA